MPDPVIAARGLTRYFGARPAVLDLDLSVPSGAVVALLGRNGAGKSTALRMMLGLVAPTRGSATVFGRDSATLPPAERARIGLLTESHPVDGWMRLEECATFAASFHPGWKHEVFRDMLARFELDPRARAGDLSRGQRAWLALALTLAPDPELLVLDDPALGLDPVARQTLVEAMVEVMHRPGRTILFSTHHLDDVERVADRIAIIERGRLRADCTLDEFMGRVRRVVLRFAGDAPAPPRLPGLLRHRRVGKELSLDLSSGAADTTAEIDRTLAALGAERIDAATLSFSDAAIGFLGHDVLGGTP